MCLTRIKEIICNNCVCSDNNFQWHGVLTEYNIYFYVAKIHALLIINDHVWMSWCKFTKQLEILCIYVELNLQLFDSPFRQLDFVVLVKPERALGLDERPAGGVFSKRITSNVISRSRKSFSTRTLRDPSTRNSIRVSFSQQILIAEINLHSNTREKGKYWRPGLFNYLL